MRRSVLVCLSAWALLAAGCATPQPPSNEEINAAAEAYVRAALALGVHDPDYVDAYFGPAQWREEATAEAASMELVAERSEALAAHIDALAARDPENARLASLQATVAAMRMRMRLLAGEAVAFDEQTLVLFGVVAPDLSDADLQARLDALEALFPGDGPLIERIASFNASLIIPEDRLLAVMEAAIAECKARTLAHYDLPEGEGFELVLVRDKPWGGFNYYLGDYQSRIEINIDRPIDMARAIDLGCHEGYPGHHVYGVLRDQTFVRANGWPEFQLYPLYAPSAIIAEGTAEYGIDMAFPGEEKQAFEREVLFPLAGLEPELANQMDAFADIPSADGLMIDVARDYLEGALDREAAIEKLMRYAPTRRDSAEAIIGFIDYSGPYIVNYSTGYDLIEGYFDRLGIRGDDRWVAYRDLLITPILPRDLME